MPRWWWGLESYKIHLVQVYSHATSFLFQLRDKVSTEMETASVSKHGHAFIFLHGVGNGMTTFYKYLALKGGRLQADLVLKKMRCCFGKDSVGGSCCLTSNRRKSSISYCVALECVA